MRWGIETNYGFEKVRNDIFNYHSSIRGLSNDHDTFKKMYKYIIQKINNIVFHLDILINNNFIIMFNEIIKKINEIIKNK